MSDPNVLIVMYMAAVAVLVAEMFIPSYGVLTGVGLGVWIAAIYRTFDLYGEGAGLIATLGSAVGLPVLAVIAIKTWPKTRIGRMVIPPNPVYSPSDFGTAPQELESLIGRGGRALTPLRPVGACEFDGRRLQCVAESGLIGAGVAVRAVGVKGRHLEVAVADEDIGA